MKDYSGKQRIPLSARIRGSGLFRVYNWKDERGRGRACMLLSAIFSGIAGQLSGGIFYNGFLLAYGFDLGTISILTFIPFIITPLYILSPSVLERFRRRKLVLAVARLTVHTINIIGITVLPMLFSKDADGNIINKNGMLVAFLAVIISANVINALFSQGYAAWHANFLTDEIRADYFSSSQCINALLTYIVVFVLSIVADSVKNTPSYLPVLTVMRFVGYALAIIDVILLMIPKEYEYSKTVEKPKIRYIFTLPFKNRRFFMTILVIVFVTLSANIHAGFIDGYVLNVIGIPYSLTNGINALYFAFFIMFGSLWKKFIAKNTWFRALGFALLIEAASYLLYSFIAPGRVALYVVVRLWQHVMGVGRSIMVSSLLYLNLPEADRTNYLSFYTIFNNMAALIARVSGHLIYENVGKSSFIMGAFSAIGINGEVPILIFMCATLEALASIPCFLWFRKITPDHLLGEYDARRTLIKQMRAEKKAAKLAKKAQ